MDPETLIERSIHPSPGRGAAVGIALWLVVSGVVMMLAYRVVSEELAATCAFVSGTVIAVFAGVIVHRMAINGAREHVMWIGHGFDGAAYLKQLGVERLQGKMTVRVEIASADLDRVKSRAAEAFVALEGSTLAITSRTIAEGIVTNALLHRWFLAIVDDVIEGLPANELSNLRATIE